VVFAVKYLHIKFYYCFDHPYSVCPCRPELLPGVPFKSPGLLGHLLLSVQIRVIRG